MNIKTTHHLKTGSDGGWGGVEIAHFWLLWTHIFFNSAFAKTIPLNVFTGNNQVIRFFIIDKISLTLFLIE